MTGLPSLEEAWYFAVPTLGLLKRLLYVIPVVLYSLGVGRLSAFAFMLSNRIRYSSVFMIDDGGRRDGGGVGLIPVGNGIL